MNTLKDIKVSYIDTSIVEDMHADFLVEGLMDGATLEEKVSLRDIDILNFMNKTKEIQSLSSYDFMLIVKKMKDFPDSDFTKNILAPKAIQQHDKKEKQIDKLTLMAELIRPKSNKNKKLITYNSRGEIVVNQSKVV